jgi:hypothetical protein
MVTQLSTAGKKGNRTYIGVPRGKCRSPIRLSVDPSDGSGPMRGSYTDLDLCRFRP